MSSPSLSVPLAAYFFPRQTDNAHPLGTSNCAGECSNHVKRPQAASSELSPVPSSAGQRRIPKRVRQISAMDEIPERSTSGDRTTEAQNASAPVYTTTTDQSTSLSDGGVDQANASQTSEGEEGSVLFSEQAGRSETTGEETGGRERKRIRTEAFSVDSQKRCGRKIARLAAAADDFLVEGMEGSEDEQEDEADEDSASMDVGEEEEEGEGGGEGEETDSEAEAAAPNAADGNHEESQDPNDLPEEDDDEGDESLVWLKQPHRIPTNAQRVAPKPVNADRMSCFLEPAPRTSKRPAPQEVASNPDDPFGLEVVPDEPVPSPSSYHSGDSEDFDMAHRPVLERAEVKKDIRLFLDSLGATRQGRDTGTFQYKVVDRLGEGTYRVDSRMGLD